MPIDDSVVENALRRVTVGGENDLHLGSEHGGRTMSVVYAFTCSCTHFAIHPVACLQKVLSRLPCYPAEQLVELLPDLCFMSDPSAWRKKAARVCGPIWATYPIRLAQRSGFGAGTSRSATGQ